ncbi:MAG: arsenite methyltransferase [Thermomicrobiales bacterium]
MPPDTISFDRIRDTVREKYAERAQAAVQTQSGCGPGCCGSIAADPITSDLYSEVEAGQVPGLAVQASLGCGNPTALAALRPGERVLDLGAGGGIDVLLSARRVGPEGFVYGLDMTDEMLAIAERNRQDAGVDYVQFLKGHIEEIPLPDASVDVVISNCVINLSSDKGRVLREAYRVLAPGGRFAVSDVVVRGALPEDLRQDMEAWIGCVAGALDETVYRGLLAGSGFTEIEIQETRRYEPRDLRERLAEGGSCCGPSTGMARDWDEAAFDRFEQSGGAIFSAFVRAVKPEVAPAG